MIIDDDDDDAWEEEEELKLIIEEELYRSIVTSPLPLITLLIFIKP